MKRTSMKCLIIVCLLSPLPCLAQGMIVTNPTADVKLAESILLAEEQAMRLNDQMELLEKAQEQIEKVNNTIRQVDLIKQIVQDQQEIIGSINRSFNNLQDSEQFSPQELSNILQTFTRLITQSEQHFALITDILKDGVFQMNDSERLQILMDLESKLKEIKGDHRILKDKYERIAQKRALIKALKKKN